MHNNFMMMMTLSMYDTYVKCNQKHGTKAKP